MTESEIIKTVWKEFQKTLGPGFSLYLFGSRASHTHSQYSDFDFFIKGKDPITPQKWLQFQEAVEEIETLYKIDLIDFEKAGDDFKKVASKSAKEIVNGQIRS